MYKINYGERIVTIVIFKMMIQMAKENTMLYSLLKNSGNLRVMNKYIEKYDENKTSEVGN